MSPIVYQNVRKQALYSVHTSLSLSFSSFHDDILPVTPNKYLITILIQYHCKHLTETTVNDRISLSLL